VIRVLVIGAAGMIGRKLARRLAGDGAIGDRGISALALVDVVAAPAPESGRGPAPEVDTIVADVTEPDVATELVASRPEVIFDLAAVVSGEAEDDFQKGYRVNLDGTRLLLEAIRAAGPGYGPRLVITSSVAVFGPPFPDVIGDEQRTTPATSYGTQKAIGELLVSDYTRRGFLARTWPHPGSSPTSSESRSTAGRPCFRSARTFVTGSPPRAQPSSSWSMPQRSTAKRSDRRGR
jgi:nucleoside-diphosphate-sugar epimerase